MEHYDILVCVCGDVAHQIVVSYNEGDGDKMVYLTINLNKLPLWKRIKEGIKYIFGHQCKYGAFDEVILSPKDADKLQKVVDYLKKCEDE